MPFGASRLWSGIMGTRRMSGLVERLIVLFLPVGCLLWLLDRHRTPVCAAAEQIARNRPPGGIDVIAMHVALAVGAIAAGFHFADIIGYSRVPRYGRRRFSSWATVGGPGSAIRVSLLSLLGLFCGGYLAFATAWYLFLVEIPWHMSAACFGPAAAAGYAWRAFRHNRSVCRYYRDAAGQPPPQRAARLGHAVFGACAAITPLVFVAVQPRVAPRESAWCAAVQEAAGEPEAFCQMYLAVASGMTETSALSFRLPISGVLQGDQVAEPLGRDLASSLAEHPELALRFVEMRSTTPPDCVGTLGHNLLNSTSLWPPLPSSPSITLDGLPVQWSEVPMDAGGAKTVRVGDTNIGAMANLDLNTLKRHLRWIALLKQRMPRVLQAALNLAQRQHPASDSEEEVFCPRPLSSSGATPTATSMAVRAALCLAAGAEGAIRLFNTFARNLAPHPAAGGRRIDIAASPFDQCNGEGPCITLHNIQRSGAAPSRGLPGPEGAVPFMGPGDTEDGKSLRFERHATVVQAEQSLMSGFAGRDRVVWDLQTGNLGAVEGTASTFKFRIRAAYGLSRRPIGPTHSRLKKNLTDRLCDLVTVVRPSGPDLRVFPETTDGRRVAHALSAAAKNGETSGALRNGTHLASATFKHLKYYYDALDAHRCRRRDDSSWMLPEIRFDFGFARVIAIQGTSPQLLADAYFVGDTDEVQGVPFADVANACAQQHPDLPRDGRSGVLDGWLLLEEQGCPVTFEQGSRWAPDVQATALYVAFDIDSGASASHCQKAARRRGLAAETLWSIDKHGEHGVEILGSLRANQTRCVGFFWVAFTPRAPGTGHEGRGDIEGGKQRPGPSGQVMRGGSR